MLRYILRLAIAAERIALRADGGVELTLSQARSQRPPS
jgi:hypothetical protein